MGREVQNDAAKTVTPVDGTQKQERKDLHGELFGGPPQGGAEQVKNPVNLRPEASNTSSLAGFPTVTLFDSEKERPGLQAKPAEVAEAVTGQKPDKVKDNDAFLVNKLQKPDSLNDIEKTAADLVKASPDDRQKILTDAADKFRQNNPDTTSFAFVGLLNNSLKETKGNELSAKFAGSFGAKTDALTSEIVNKDGRIEAVAFVGNEPSAKVAFETAQAQAVAIDRAQASIPSDKQEEFQNRFAGAKSANDFNKLFLPLGEIKPREPAKDQAEDEKRSNLLLGDLADGFPTSLSDSDNPRRFFDTLKEQGKKLAFAAGKDEGAVGEAALEALKKESPRGKVENLANMLALSANRASDTDDFKVVTGAKTVVNSGDNSDYIIDRRQSNPVNPLGKIAGFFANDNDPIGRQAFAAATEVTAIQRAGLERLPEPLTESSVRSFNDSLLSFSKRPGDMD